jgi:ABC-type nickel/cobalt efflux system permease component RcnA
MGNKMKIKWNIKDWWIVFIAFENTCGFLRIFRGFFEYFSLYSSIHEHSYFNINSNDAHLTHQNQTRHNNFNHHQKHLQKCVNRSIKSDAISTFSTWITKGFQWPHFHLSLPDLMLLIDNRKIPPKNIFYVIF